MGDKTSRSGLELFLLQFALPVAFAKILDPTIHISESPTASSRAAAQNTHSVNN